MNIDIHTETLQSLNQARAHQVFSTQGRRASIEKMYRLAMYGAKDMNGGRVRLETVKLPGGLHTSVEAISRFIQRLTDPDASIPTPAPKVRREQIEAAERELQAAGFEVGSQ